MLTPLVSGAFSGLLAAGIEQMRSLAGLPGWGWIFLLEGLFTILFAAFAFWVLPNTPQQVKTFQQHHKDWCEQRLRNRTSTESHRITSTQVFSVFKDLQIWIFWLALFCNGTTSFGLAYFTPSIVATLGFDTTKTQLLSIPPFACAFLVTVILAYLSDRYKARGLSSIAGNLIALIGFAIFLTKKSKEAKYGALICLLIRIYAAIPSLIR